MRILILIFSVFASPVFSREIDGLSISFMSPEGSLDTVLIRPEMNLEVYIFKWVDQSQPATASYLFPDFKYWADRGKPEPSFVNWVAEESASYLQRFQGSEIRDSEIHALEPVECGDFTGFQCWFEEKEDAGVERLHTMMFVTDGCKKMKVMFRGPRRLELKLWESLKTIKSKASQSASTMSENASLFRDDP